MEILCVLRATHAPFFYRFESFSAMHEISGFKILAPLGHDLFTF